MNARERVLAALNREELDRFPVDIWLTPEIRDGLMAKHGVQTELDLYRKMAFDKLVWINPPSFPLEGQADEQGVTMNSWGVRMREQQAGQAKYLEAVTPPLAEYETPESLDDYPNWPDPASLDFSAVAAHAAAVHQEFVTLGPWVSFFEIYCQLRGLENAMMDVLVNPALVNGVLDRVELIQTEVMQGMFDTLGDDLDLVFLSDDMASQDNLLFSLDVWDMFLKERMHRWCNFIHDNGFRVFYHSDGAVAPLLSRLIEAGIDVLNPIQHACPGMEMNRLQQEFGKDVVFHGGVENQRVLPFGSTAEVKEEVENCMRQLGAAGTGYIVCSCHNVQPGTPLENVEAMVETVQAYKP